MSQPVALVRSAVLPPFRPAAVVGGRGADVDVVLDGVVVPARLAIAERPRVGDEVLIADGGHEHRYVIGVLRGLREAPVLATTGDGTTVRLREFEGSEVLTIESPDGALLFEHRDGRSRICAPRGTLELRAEAGDLELRAAKRVRLEADEGVELRSARGVRLDVDSSHLSLTRRGLQVVVDELRAKLGRAETAVRGDANLEAEVVTVAAEVVRTKAQQVQLDADQLVERARESFRDIKELAQTRAGRMRMVAEETFRVLAERTLLKARQDVKLKGKTIYLD
jgi:hypothetical protein